MSDFSDEEFIKLCKLAKLEYDQATKERFCGSIKSIIDHIETLLSVDTEGVEPAVYVGYPDEQKMSTDEPIENLYPVEDFIKNAPDHIGTMIKIPAFMGEDPTSST